MEIRKAQKQKAKLRIGLSSPSGGGKTYSALLIASGITSMDKVVLIDTENGSGDLYDHLGDYSVLTLQAPFSPERYIKAIEECEKAGFDVIIIDSITHEWEGNGGCLEINEQTARAKFKGNTWSAWSDTGARHQKFLNKIVQSSAHIITTVRNKTETAVEGRKITKVGTKEITREGFEYELTVNFNIERDTHNANASKDRTGLFEGIDYFIPTKETGLKLKKWADNGIEVVKQDPPKKYLELNDAVSERVKQLLLDGNSYEDIFKKMEDAGFTIKDETKDEIKKIKAFDLPDDKWDKKEEQKTLPKKDNEPIKKEEPKKEKPEKKEVVLNDLFGVKKEETKAEVSKEELEAVEKVIERIEKITDIEELKSTKENFIKSAFAKKCAKESISSINLCFKIKEGKLENNINELDI